MRLSDARLCPRQQKLIYLNHRLPPWLNEDDTRDRPILLLGRRQRTDCDVIPVRVPQRELRSTSVLVQVWLLLESSDESARPWQRHCEIIDTEKQKEAIARLRVIGARQGGMLMGTPLVKAQQHRSIRVEDLTEVVMGWSRLRQAQ